MGFVAIAARAPVYKAQPKPEQWRAIRHAAERRERAMRSALAEAFADVRDAVDVEALMRACEARFLQGVLDAIPFGRLQASLIPAIAIINAALTEGGSIAGRQLVEQLFPIRKAGNLYDFEIAKKKSRAKYDIRFDLTNPAAVRWASENAGRLITQVSNETKKGVRVLVERAFVQGIPPRPLAKLIRESGIGLTRPQSTALTNYMNQLIADGLTDDRIRQLIARRGEKMLQYRSLVIARQELLQASNRGQSLLWSEAGAAGLIPAETQKRKWIITRDDRLCPLCAQMTGERAITGVNEPWSTPTGEVTIPQQIHVMCRCAQGLVIDLNVAREQAAEAVANPSPELARLMPNLAGGEA